MIILVEQLIDDIIEYKCASCQNVFHVPFEDVIYRFDKLVPIDYFSQTISGAHVPCDTLRPYMVLRFYLCKDMYKFIS